MSDFDYPTNVLDVRWPAAAEVMHSQGWHILGVVDFNQTRYDPETIFNILKVFKKDYYAPNERIIIKYDTVDFFPIGKDAPGIRLYNIFKCIDKLDIPLWVFGIDTNHYGLSKFTEILSKEVCHDDVNTPVLVCFHYKVEVTPNVVAPVDISIDDIQFKYSLFAGGGNRPHRVALLSMLESDNLIDNGLVSWGNVLNASCKNYNDEYKINLTKKLLPYWFLYVSPNFKIDYDAPWESSGISFLCTTTNDVISNWRPYSELAEAITQHNNKFLNSNYKHPLIESPAIVKGLLTNGFLPSALVTNHFLPSIRKSFLYISSESVFDYPCTVITEKTFRPLYHKRPFVVFGAPGTLKMLKEAYGFKTFNEFWDESYDNETDPNKRFKKVYSIVKQINSLSIDQLKELCNNMQDTIEFNFNHYNNVFANDNTVKKYIQDMFNRQNSYV